MDFATQRAMDESKLTEGSLTEGIIWAAIEVHSQMGPGLLESAYEACMCRELAERKLPFKRQIDVPVHYKGVALDCEYKIDILMTKLCLSSKLSRLSCQFTRRNCSPISN